MLWGDEKRLCLLYALTPIHAGAGQALKAVDLPIQRERHTAWPMVQASGVKGTLRDWCEKAWENNGIDKDLVKYIFGRAGEEGGSWAGAVTVTDARLLLFPVRSNVAPFVHVTCPAVLKRLREELSLLGLQDKLSENYSVGEEEYIVLKGGISGEIVLEDMVVKPKQTQEKTNWLPNNIPEAEKILLVSDEVFGYLVRTATEVQAHIAIKDDTGTAEDGSLRYQEYLPADTVLYFLAFFSDERSKRDQFKSAQEIAQLVTEHGVTTHLQIGGDFTLGKGICKVKWIAPKDSQGGAK
ncbi:CRISPR-associated RAMP protein, Cmr4 family [Thermodesulfatator indicus DSM 15286]|uniref:CRISPR-associated RAMP protein, Cmr4 family n=1 Tax=Thermodesulfatator indicus (strain DSM 15286 / JCM 11887 / CIR29812) TaxID=667014 RepID=F8A973_THEID|nr:type III-B CRISPR module RAMP protein Cmr4 [Thermodesulfatator indicus]AEH45209.1 CRISPR-associated RAMP protein, Cmr4 family [Thermodesulfatator indicus DSM 15286]